MIILFTTRYGLHGRYDATRTGLKIKTYYYSIDMNALWAFSISSVFL
ncbi:hypothetical protein [Bacteroides sp. 519]|nr:hypothetical protein [Bacteroides sp. 519]